MEMGPLMPPKALKGIATETKASCPQLPRVKFQMCASGSHTVVLSQDPWAASEEADVF